MSGAKARKGHTQLQWEGKFFQCGRQCVYCGEPLTLARATKDHELPVSRGGTDDISNIVPACFPCNVRKGRKTAKEFIASRRFDLARSSKSTATALNLPVAPVDQAVNFELLNNSRLIEELRRESESTSFAWRHPA